MEHVLKNGLQLQHAPISEIIKKAEEVKVKYQERGVILQELTQKSVTIVNNRNITMFEKQSVKLEVSKEEEKENGLDMMEVDLPEEPPNVFVCKNTPDAEEETEMDVDVDDVQPASFFGVQR